MKILFSNLTFTFLIIFNLSIPKNNRFVVSILDFNGKDINPKLLKMCYQRLETRFKPAKQKNKKVGVWI